MGIRIQVLTPASAVARVLPNTLQGASPMPRPDPRAVPDRPLRWLDR